MKKNITLKSTINLSRVIDHKGLRMSELACGSCSNLISLDLSKSCQKCQVNFCYQCVQNFSNENCILCKKMKLDEDLLELPKLEKLRNIEIVCKNKINGCQKILPYKNLFTHENYCNFLIKMCDLCNLEYVLEEKDTHRFKCLEIEIECQKCNFRTKRKDFSHLCDEVIINSYFKKLDNFHKLKITMGMIYQMSAIIQNFISEDKSSFDLNNSHENIKYIENLSKNPLDGEILKWKVKLSYDIKQYEKSLECCDQYLKINPNDADSHFYKGKIYFQMEKYKQAIECYNKAIKLNPIKIIYKNKKEETYQKMKRSTEAKKYSISMIGENSIDYNSFLEKGKYFTTINKDGDAIKCFDHSIKIDPKNKEAYKLKGEALLEIQKYKDALKCFNQAILIDPYDDSVYGCKGNTLYSLGEYQEAINCYENAIKISPRYSYHYDKGYTYFYLNKMKEALGCFNEALKIDSNNVGALEWKGKILHELKRFEESIKTFQEILKLDPNNENSHLCLGDIYFQLKEHKESIFSYENVLRINPNHKIALENKLQAEKNHKKNNFKI